jgi:hypothetical protein
MNSKHILVISAICVVIVAGYYYATRKKQLPYEVCSKLVQDHRLGVLLTSDNVKSDLQYVIKQEVVPNVIKEIISQSDSIRGVLTKENSAVNGYSNYVESLQHVNKLLQLLQQAQEMHRTQKLDLPKELLYMCAKYEEQMKELLAIEPTIPNECRIARM